MHVNGSLKNFSVLKASLEPHHWKIFQKRQFYSFWLPRIFFIAHYDIFRLQNADTGWPLTESGIPSVRYEPLAAFNYELNHDLHGWKVTKDA